MEMKELNLEAMEKASGGFVVSDSETNKFWIVRQDGSIIGPAPTMEQAIEFAKPFGESTTVLSKEEYKVRFGRDLVW